MKSLIATALCVASFTASFSQARAESVTLGKIEFLVDTNVKAFKFKGEAQQLQAKLDRTGNRLKHLELTIPVQSLNTGLDLRDKHMRERVFTKADGSMPDIVFRADAADCANSPCKVLGTLTLRGETRPLELTLTVKDPAHVEGSSEIELSKFGIEDPAQLGVKVSDKVAVHFDVGMK